MAGEILFLAHRIPFPPDRGDKIRSHHILRALARLAPVHVGCLGDGADDLGRQGDLAQIAASHCLVPRRKPLLWAGAEALARHEPVSMAAFASPRLAQWAQRLLADRPIAAIYVFSGQMGQYVPADHAGRLVVDLVDVDSAKFEAYGKAGKGLRALIDRREGALLRAAEAALVGRAHHTLLVSEPEAQLLRDRCAGAGKIGVLANGIDCAAYDPRAIGPEPALAAGPGPHIVFTGQMDYAPNVAAVCRFARGIFGQIRTRHPQAQFHIVGRAPTAPVRRLGDLAGIKVVGAVADTRGWLAGADLVVAPLEIARGVQNKVLEAMAMARPVLASPGAATGIAGVHGEHLLICADDDAFVNGALGLLARPEEGARIGQAARRLVRFGMSWEATLAPLAGILGLDPRQEQPSAAA